MSTSTIQPIHPFTSRMAHIGKDRSRLPTIGQVLRVGVPLTMLAVLASATLVLWLLDAPIGEAFGLGAYLSFWIGGGFGVILSSAYREYRQDQLKAHPH